MALVPVCRFMLFLLVLLWPCFSSTSTTIHHGIKCSSLDLPALLALNSSYPSISSYPSMSWSGEDCCSWSGISCNVAGRVIGLELPGVAFEGPIPRVFCNLTMLEILSVAAVFEGGVIPSCLCRLEHLRSLSLDGGSVGNSLGTTDGISFGVAIPDCFGELASLQVLDLSNNGLNGSIPASLCKLQQLTKLSLDGNRFQGAPPQCLSTLPRLYSLSLGGWDDASPLHLDSAFLSSLHLLTNLTYAHFDTVRLVDVPHPLPYYLTSLHTLQDLYIDDVVGTFGSGALSHFCNLTRLQTLYYSSSPSQPPDQIPPCLSQLVHLSELFLGDNNLSGTIPSELQRLSNLTWLGLSGNNLNGSLPSWIGKLTNLTGLFLDDNRFQGSFPPQWQNLNLSGISLSLSDNQLEIGQLPDWILQVSGLRLSSCGISSLACSSPLNHTFRDWDLSFNNLTGDALHCLARSPLQFEYSLDLSGNPLDVALPTNWLATGDTLDLSSCRLSGPIPPTFLVSTGVTSLQFLNLSGNGLAGSIPSEIGQMSNVINLDLSGNRLAGTIPSEIGRMPNASWLDLSGNGLAGNIPSEIGQLSSMYYLDLSGNELAGNIPSEIGQMSNLATLRLDHNSLEGRIPPQVGDLQGLEILQLHSNNLSGPIPMLSNSSSMLSLIDFSNNSLTGTLEDFGLSQLSNLRVLSLASNDMHGPIPAWIGDFSAVLQVLDLSGNRFSGSIPVHLQLPAFHKGYVGAANLDGWNYTVGTLSEVIQLDPKGSPLAYPYIPVALVALNLAGNFLTGGIPSSLGNLSGLVFLNLSRNSLTGPLPASLADLSVLETLDLSFNRLQGSIPPDFSKLTSLEVFNVSFNRLCGSIPQSAQFGSFPNTSYLSNKGLCGTPILQACTDRLTAACSSTSLPAPTAPPDSPKSTSLIHLLKERVSLQGVYVGYPIGFTITIAFLEGFRLRRWLKGR